MNKKRFRYAHLTLASLLAATAFCAQAAEGQWTSGYGQGNHEFFMDVKGMQLHIACPTAQGSADAASGVSLLTVPSQQAVSKFQVAVNGRTYEGPFEADNRAGESHFIALLADLRKADAVIRYAGKTTTFPKSNAAAVLPLFGTTGFSCNLG